MYNSVMRILPLINDIISYSLFKTAEILISTEPFDSAPCKNGAVCANQGTDYKCTCIGGFTGKDCDVPPSLQIFHLMYY